MTPAPPFGFDYFGDFIAVGGATSSAISEFVDSLSPPPLPVRLQKIARDPRQNILGFAWN
jgi:hypothetical protein